MVCFQKAVFVRITKDLVSDMKKSDFKFSPGTVEALMPATTAAGVERVVTAAMYPRHAKTGRREARGFPTQPFMKPEHSHRSLMEPL